MATLYYLNWDKERANDGPASELFSDLHGVEDAAEALDPSEFDDLYREVADDVDVDEPGEAWEEWNAGSGRESERFLELRYCERCDTYIDGREEAVTHAAQNHGYDAFDAEGAPDYIHGERSMSVGDVVEIDGTYHVAAAIGWDEIEVADGEAGSGS